MTAGPTRSRVSATTEMNPRVNRPWKVRGIIRRSGRGSWNLLADSEPGAAPATVPAAVPGAVPDGAPGSALGEGVAGTSNGQHEDRRRWIVLDLLAQVADVDIDRLLVLIERLVVAQQLEQLAP